MRKVLRVFKKIAEELWLDLEQWPFIVSVVKMALNLQRTRNRADKLSIELFSGRKPLTMAGLVVVDSAKVLHKLPWTVAQCNSNVQSLRDALTAMHRQVFQIRNQRNKEIKKQRKNIKKCNI